MKAVHLRDGREVTIRKALKEDAAAMIAFYNAVAGETDFLSFGKNEFVMSLEEYERFIESACPENNAILIIATIDDEIASIASITSNQKKRYKHVGTLGIVIAEKYCGLGLGRKLMEELIDWAKLNETTTKIDLVTREDNARAIELYKKVGFEVEGRLRNDCYSNGVYYDTIVMGLLI
ncbi:GNAT family N-acetyltransferase [Priestia megaterium]|nr:GNAT family N-acetyltransferase [Priestia megaterium]